MKIMDEMMDEADFYARGDGSLPIPPTIIKLKDRNEPPTPKTKHSYDYLMKSWPAFFSQMIVGRKKHDMRDMRDRDYSVGDQVLLCEYDPFGGGYSGRWAIFEITYITSNVTPCAMSSSALDGNHCILSVQLLEASH